MLSPALRQWRAAETQLIDRLMVIEADAVLETQDGPVPSLMDYDFHSAEGTAGSEPITRVRRGRKPRSQRGLHPRRGKMER